MSVLEEIVVEAARLAGTSGAGLLVTVGILLAGAVIIVLGGKVKLPPPDPEPAPPPTAEWSDNVVPGPPGGTDDQIQGG